MKLISKSKMLNQCVRREAKEFRRYMQKEMRGIDLKQAWDLLEMGPSI